MKELLEYIAKNLVDDPDAVEVTQSGDEDNIQLQLRVSPEDMGKVIGRGGRTARAIRTVVRAAATTSGVSISVEIVE
ncbi:MAG TPA: RNA-binding protein [Actinobacteria bacterium]|nr:RNA-binding protein [Actinomycetota bacterium]HCP61959.1 RNA-binding protein [Actinomycetota bacterium]